jgi:hypothetical protein
MVKTQIWAIRQIAAQWGGSFSIRAAASTHGWRPLLLPQPLQLLRLPRSWIRRS